MDNISNEDLKKKLFKRIPGLAESIEKNNQLRTVRLLRSWAATTIPLAQVNSLDLSFEKELEYLDKLKLGYRCGGCASFLSKLYHLFGFSSCRIGCGLKDTSLMHAMTLVEIEIDNEKIILDQDAYLNGEYGTISHNFTPFIQIVKELKENNCQPKLVDHYPEAKRIRLLPSQPVQFIKMFDGDKWFKKKKDEYRQELEKGLCHKLDLEVGALSAFHLLLLPVRVFLFRNEKSRHFLDQIVNYLDKVSSFQEKSDILYVQEG